MGFHKKSRESSNPMRKTNCRTMQPIVRIQATWQQRKQQKVGQQLEKNTTDGITTGNN